MREIGGMENALDTLPDPLDAIKVLDAGAVLVGGLRQTSPGRFVAEVRQDASHAYVGRYPWMSLVMQSELHRQLSVGAVRCFVDVPASHDYALRGYSLRIADDAGALVPERIEGEVVSTKVRDGALSQAHLRLTASAGGRELSVAELRGAFVPSSLLKGLMQGQYDAEGSAPPPHVATNFESAGVSEAREVLVGEPQKFSESEWGATFVGPSVHPRFHHNAIAPDHVPGVMVFDACLQHIASVRRAQVGRARELVALEFSLERFLELDVAAEVHSSWSESAANGHEVEIAFSQRGHHCCAGTFRMR